MNLQAVILSGGSGTRLWPLSREKHPKQLLSIIGDQTMLQQTAQRLRGLSDELPVDQTVMVVCNEEYRFITAQQLVDAGYSDSKLILEPFGKNTAPALTLAALQASQQEQDRVLLVMPADHVMRDLNAFHLAIKQAYHHALNGAMVTFGIIPDRPETGYGYLETGPLQTGQAAQALLGFVEKPDLETAQRYLDGGQHLWNSGLFMMRASVWLKAMQAFQPEMLAACQQAMTDAKLDQDFIRIDKQAFANTPADSIDYAVMEKLQTQPALEIPGVVIPLQAGWSDVGAWDAVWQNSEKDQNNNVGLGDAILEQCQDSFIYAGHRLVAGLGLHDVIVVETPDAVLVANKAHTQEIKKIVNRLKLEAPHHTENHRKVYRPWGHYDSIDAGPGFQVKRIVVKPGGRLSMQLHHHRAEHWIVVSGKALVTRGDDVMTLVANQSTYIPLGVKHRLENPGDCDLELIEVQSGSYLGEDDIVRFDDIYGRIGN